VRSAGSLSSTVKQDVCAIRWIAQQYREAGRVCRQMDLHHSDVWAGDRGIVSPGTASPTKLGLELGILLTSYLQNVRLRPAALSLGGRPYVGRVVR
jgi:hypothetical protein